MKQRIDLEDFAIDVDVTSHFLDRLKQRFPKMVTGFGMSTCFQAMPLAAWLPAALLSAKTVPHRYGSYAKSKYRSSVYLYAAEYDILFVFSGEREGLTLRTAYVASDSHWLWRVSFWHSDPEMWPDAVRYLRDQVPVAVEHKIKGKYQKGIDWRKAEEEEGWKNWFAKQGKGC